MIRIVEVQTYTSAGTSINKTKLPAVYKKVNFEEGSEILDYGCGRYTDHIQDYVESLGCTYYPYDPYNQPGSKLPNHTVDYAVCSNVLNVIDDLDTVKEVIDTVCNAADTAYFTVYEGNKSGTGKVSGKDMYQRNAGVKWYLELIKDMGYNASLRNGVITVK